MLVIGLTGLAGSGKSTAAARLIERHGFKLGKFAGPLKAMFRALLEYRGATAGQIDAMIDGDLKEVPSPFLAGRTSRHAMQTLGTEWGRDHIGPELWVDAALDALNLDSGCPAHLRPERIVFDDVRFPNEVAAIRRLGGKIWRISRTIPDFNRGRSSKASPATHSSEVLAALPDRSLGNYGGKAELGAVVDMHVVTLVRAAEKAA